MAASTIPGAGCGVFTAIDLEEGDFVGSGDVAIPLIEVESHLGLIFDYFDHFLRIMYGTAIFWDFEMKLNLMISASFGQVLIVQ